jgi:predicted ABC-type ATPase
MTRLLVYAGPNGSGKSSLRDQGVLPDPVEVVIDPDRIARSLNPGDPRAADRAAGQAAIVLSTPA